jgi:nitrogen fixation protein FixH
MIPVSGNGRRPRRRLQIWPWALALVLVAFGLVQATLIVLASWGFEGPDDPNYYRHGLEYSSEVQRARRQEQLGWRLDTNLPSTLRADAAFLLEVRLRDREGRGLEGAHLTVKLGRPATRRQDQETPLEAVGGGLYRGQIRPGPGTWDLTLVARRGAETVVKKRRFTTVPAR